MTNDPKPDGLPYVLPDAVITAPGAGGSSGFGMSYWLPFLGCAERAALERQTGRNAGPNVDDEGNQKVNRYGKPVLNQTLVGLLFHKILEHYHAHEGCACVFRYDAGEESLEWKEALRYFEAYRPVTPPDMFGKVEACEEAFAIGMKETDGFECDCQSAEDHASHLRALNLLGVPYFTGRRDMRTSVVSQRHVDYLMGMGAFDAEPGDVVIVDTKTKTREDQTLMAEMHESAQFHAYMTAARALGLKIKGTVANVVIGTKDIKIKRWWIPYPTERQEQVVKEMLTEARWRRDHLGVRFRNPRHCYDYFKLCPFYLKECDRTNASAVERLVQLRSPS